MIPIVKGTRVTGDDRDALTDVIARKYQDGASIRAIAEESGRAYGTIHRLLVDSGVQLRSRGGNRRAARP